MAKDVQYYQEAAQNMGEFSKQDTIGTEATPWAWPQVRELTPSRLPESFHLLSQCPPCTYVNS